MATTLNEIFHVDFASEVVNRYAASSNYLLNYFNFQPGGIAERRSGGRRSGYDIVNRSRTPGTIVGPSQPSTSVRKKVLGHVDLNMFQLKEHVNVLYEEIGYLRPLGTDATRNQLTLEPFGEDKIREYMMDLGDRVAALRSLTLCGMLRGTLYGHLVGEQTVLTFSNTLSGSDANAILTVDWTRPATHSGRLTGLITSGVDVLNNWATESNDIPGQLDKINDGLIKSRGGRLEVIILNSNTFNNVMKNTEVATQAGSSVTPFEQFEVEVGTDRDGRPMTIRTARLRCRPMYQFIICDEYLDIGFPGAEVSTKMIPDDYIWAGPRPTTSIFSMYVGSQLVVEQIGTQAVERYGSRTYTREIDDPVGRKLHAVDMMFPTMKVPTSNVWGYVGA